MDSLETLMGRVDHRVLMVTNKLEVAESDNPYGLHQVAMAMLGVENTQRERGKLCHTSKMAKVTT